MHKCGNNDYCNHASDCAVHNEPAYPAGECDCYDTHSDDVHLAKVYEIFKMQLEINQIFDDRLKVLEANLSYNSVEPEEGA